MDTLGGKIWWKASCLDILSLRLQAKAVPRSPRARKPDAMSTIRLLCLPLVVDLLIVIAPNLILVVWSASASNTQ